jgi:predicted DNA-binding transcriptional regulator AlpA
MNETDLNQQRMLIPPRDAARMLSISEKNLWTLTKKGAIPAIRVGARSVRYCVAQLERWIADQPTAAA